MAPSIYPPLVRWNSPSMEAIRAPNDLSSEDLTHALLSIASELLSSSSGKEKMAFHWRNSRSLLRKTQIFIVLLESLKERRLEYYSFTALMCFKELYLLLCRSKMLLDYCFQSSKLWLILQNVLISGHFNDLNQEISTLLDVLPIDELNLSVDVWEQVELLKRQLRKEKLCDDRHNEALRRRLHSFLKELETGRVPDYDDLHSFFVNGVGIHDSTSCMAEIELLEEQMCNNEEDLDPLTRSGIIALARFSKVLLFRFEEDEIKPNPRIITKCSSVFGAPKDFCCPISLDLMMDPVVVSTGQTYDRSSIVRWMDDGHSTCPKTGQMLTNNNLVPNQALRNMILQWCNANGITLDGCADQSLENVASVLVSKAALEANRATTALLIRQLEEGTDDLKAKAAGEIRSMARTSNRIRAYMAEAGVIISLSKLLSSSNGSVQENSVTALLNLSIHDGNKSMIMEEQGCLEMIVDVLRCGHTSVARENAAAALFSLSISSHNKKRIADSDGAIEALVLLLKDGTTRGRKDAVTALFNLSTHPKNCSKMLESGAVKALVLALEVEGASEEAAAALSLIARQAVGAEAIANEESALASLIGMMRRSTPKGKENAVAALLELCRSGRSSVVDRVVKTPALTNLLQGLVYSGTKRAKRKAASLARAFQRREQAALRYGGAALNTDSGHGNEVRLNMPISVQVL